MIVGSVLIPRFSLLSAVADRTQMLTEPIALSPEPGGDQAVGEVSGAAEAFGIHAGMQLGEALGRCPRLALVPADPGRASSEWERIVRSLERIGAEVESDRAGEAFFGVDALRGLWGPRHEDVLMRAWRAVGRPARVAGAPTRFCALAAARAGGRGRRRRSPRVIPAGSEQEFLAPQPVRLLDGRLGTSHGRNRGPDRSRRLVATLERLGVETLGELAAMPRIAIADRFGALGLRAHDLASGIDAPLRPRRPHEELIQAVGLPEAAYGAQLERALELLIERLLADPRREGRAIRSLRLEARLAEGGSWSADAVLRSASGSTERLRLALLPKLGGLAAPASALALRALELAPGGAVQAALAPDPAERRRELLAEAVRQVRAAAGRDSVLRVLVVDPGSRVPERWAVLAPYNEGA
jgi:protein ImuB